MAIMVCGHNLLSQNDKISIVSLITNTWPNEEYKNRPVVEYLDKFFGNNIDERHVFIKEENSIVGYAKTFTRDIIIGEQNVHNLALACVCVSSERRMQGFGETIVREALSLVDKRLYECSIFQTAVPQFYEKIGAKRIKNKCINSHSRNENPWWDPNVMLYPADYIVGDAIIDLSGKGY